MLKSKIRYDFIDEDKKFGHYKFRPSRRSFCAFPTPFFLKSFSQCELTCRDLGVPLDLFNCHWTL